MSDQIKIGIESLGFTMRDKISNFQGVATAWEERLYNMPRVHLSPRNEDSSKLLDTVIFDIEGLEILPDILGNDAKKVVESTQQVDHDFHLGDKVRDTISEFPGSIVSLTTCVSGCVIATLTGKVDEKGKVNQIAVPVQRLELIEKPKAPAKPVPTGGPPERFAR